MKLARQTSLAVTQRASGPEGWTRNAPKPASGWRPPLAVSGLFAGIGGIELGLARAKHETRLLCEIDEAARAVLDHQFPDLPKYDDVTTLGSLPTGTELLTAGFPCQDLSQAGTTRGIRGARSGLVGEVFRLLERHTVPWLLIENVPFMLQLAKGEALEVIVAALEHLGYRWAYRVVDSRAFGLPQRRRRVYLLASLVEDPRSVLYSDDAGAETEPPKDEWPGVACGFYWTEGVRGLGWAHDAVPTLKGGSAIGIASPPAILLPDRRLVTPHIRDAERLQGFEPDWTAPAETVKRQGFRWKLVGNAVTVDAAAWIGRRLRRPGRYDDSEDAPLRKKRAWPPAAYNVGGERMTPADLSEWPLANPRPALADFLEDEPKPLSFKATAGFYDRTKRAKLRFPKGFREAVRDYRDASAPA